eukprot:269300-Pelagomonas_calceolata.AAC.5
MQAHADALSLGRKLDREQPNPHYLKGKRCLDQRQDSGPLYVRGWPMPKEFSAPQQHVAASGAQLITENKLTPFARPEKE